MLPRRRVASLRGGLVPEVNRVGVRSMLSLAFVEDNEHLSDEAKAEQLADFEKNEKHWR